MIVIELEESRACREAEHFAEIICARENCGIEATADGANKVADFIETLTNRLTGKKPEETKE